MLSAINRCPSQCKCDIYLRRAECESTVPIDINKLPSTLVSLFIINTPITKWMHDFIFPELHYLEIHYTPLTELHIGDGFKKLEQVSVRNSNLTDLCKVVIDSKSVKKLYLPKNRMKSPNCTVHLPTITSLYLDDNAIEEFDSSKIIVTSLKTLQLTNNPLSKINLTVNVKNLKTLRVSKCLLKELDTTNFDLPKLVYADLSWNPLIKLDARKGLEYLQQLILDNTNFTDQDKLLLKKPHLRTFSMNNVPITHLSIWCEFQALERLSLRNTSIKVINSSGCRTKNLQSIFLSRSLLEVIELTDGVDGLTHLYLEETNLSKFDTRRFKLPNILSLAVGPLHSLDMTSGLEHLTALTLLRLNIKALNNSILNLPNLKQLKIYESTIQQLGPHLSFPRLHTLTLFAIKISMFNTSLWNLPSISSLNIEDSVLQHLNLGSGTKTLTTLRIRKSRVTAFNSSKYILPSIKSMFLFRCQMDVFDFSSGLENIITLSLDESNIESFSDVYTPKLEVLSIARSPLKIISMETGFSNLKRLSLSFSKLNVFDASNSNLKNLETLTLQANPITYVNLAGLINLESVNLKNTKISAFTTKKMDLPKLRSLVLDDNKLNTLYIGDEMKSLWNLHLNNMQLTYLNTSVVNATNIEYLGIRDNNITLLDITKYPNLGSIDMEGNKDKVTIKAATLSQLVGLETDQNIVECNCDLIFKIQDVPFLSYNDLLCYGGDRGEGIETAMARLGCVNKYKMMDDTKGADSKMRSVASTIATYTDAERDGKII